jgi:hypothetical protein
MTEVAFWNGLLVGWLLLPGPVFALLFYIPAPYGRHTRVGWGPTIRNSLGWMIMEAPAALLFAACFLLGQHRHTIIPWIFLGLWEAHYIHRSFIYPLNLAASGKEMPILVMSLGFLFNLCNGYLNGRYLFGLSPTYPTRWLGDPRFLIGLGLFAAGFLINRQADRILHHLRHQGGLEYKVPQGGLYRWISCPNYLGEMVEWTGWAVATWSLPGLAFALFTAANLLPRARVHHFWYHEHFPDYPPNRKALVPGLW